MVSDLADVNGIGPARLQKLEEAGITDLSDFLDYDVSSLVDEIGMSEAMAAKLKNRAEQSAVIIQTAEEREDEYNEREMRPTGIDELDRLVGGGFQQEAIIGGYGRSSSGKTQLGFHAMVAAVEQSGLPAVYIETERDRFRPERLRQFATKSDTVEKIHGIRAYDLDAQRTAYDKAVNAFDELSLLVVDSFNSRFRMSDDYVDRSDFSSRSAVVADHMNGIEDAVEALSCPAYLTLQIYGSPDMYGKADNIYGGNILKHQLSYLLYLKPDAGDLRSVTVEGHPSQPENAVNLNIGADGIRGIPK